MRESELRARLLVGEAERAARSSFHASAKAKASALREVAWTLMAIDPDYAAHLFSEAEGIDRSDKGDRVPELSAVAAALAATDPARATRLLTEAERMANSISYKPAKASALCEVAAALGVTDPGRAARLLTEAERLASSQKNADLKANLFINVAIALAATDPGRAARLLTVAERLAGSISYEQARVGTQGRIAVVLAAIDPERAEFIARLIPYEDSKVSTLVRAAAAMAVTDPARAARLLTEAERTAYSVPPHIIPVLDQPKRIAATYYDSRAVALCVVARVLAAADPGRAVRLLTEAERLADSIRSEYSRERVLSTSRWRWRSSTSNGPNRLPVPWARGRRYRRCLALRRRLQPGPRKATDPPDRSPRCELVAR